LSRSQQGPWGLASTRALTGIRRLTRIAPSRASTRRRHSETQLGGVSSRTPPSGSEEAPRRTGTPSPSRRPEAPYRRRPGQEAHTRHPRLPPPLREGCGRGDLKD
jgi:hypothetical protein